MGHVTRVRARETSYRVSQTRLGSALLAEEQRTALSSISPPCPSEYKPRRRGPTACRERKQVRSRQG